MPAMDIF